MSFDCASLNTSIGRWRMHKWSSRVQALSRMVATSDLLPLHKPFREWTEARWIESRTGCAPLLSDETLDRMLVELDEMCAD